MLGIAIHGAGAVARAHAASWKRNPHCHVVSVGSRRRSSAEALIDALELDAQVHENLDEALADAAIQVVDLCGPSAVHAPQAIAAARARKHLFVEKPICHSLEENRAVRAAVAEAGVRSIVGFVLRWNPLLANLRSLVNRGAIGDLFYVEVDYWHGLGESWSGWHWGHTRAGGGSAMLLAGCHAVDAVRWLAGREVVEVAAVANTGKGRYEFPANVVATLRFADGAIGKTSVLLDAEMPYQFNIDLVGNEGTIRDNRLWSKPLLPGQKGWTTMDAIMPDSGDVHHHPFDAQIDHFVECILEGRESHCNVADAYHTHEVCLAIDRSVEEGGRAVSLPLA